MFCNLFLLTAAFTMQPPLDSNCPVECMVNFGNGTCAIRVQDCDAGTATVMYGACFSDECGCSGSTCDCTQLQFQIPAVQCVVIGHQGPVMQSNYAVLPATSITVADIGNVVGYGDWNVTHVGNAMAPGVTGGANEYYAMFKVTHTSLATRYLGIRLSDATTGSAVTSNQNLNPNSNGDVVERGFLFTFMEGTNTRTFWFHVVGAGGAAAGGGGNPGQNPPLPSPEPKAVPDESVPPAKAPAKPGI